MDVGAKAGQYQTDMLTSSRFGALLLNADVMVVNNKVVEETPSQCSLAFEFSIIKGYPTMRWTGRMEFSGPTRVCTESKTIALAKSKIS